MLRDQLNGGTVFDGVVLGQIIHGFDQRALPIDVALIGDALSAFISELRGNCDGKNLGHE